MWSMSMIFIILLFVAGSAMLIAAFLLRFWPYLATFLAKRKSEPVYVPRHAYAPGGIIEDKE